MPRRKIKKVNLQYFTEGTSVWVVHEVNVDKAACPTCGNVPKKRTYKLMRGKVVSYSWSTQKYFDRMLKPSYAQYVVDIAQYHHYFHDVEVFLTQEEAEKHRKKLMKYWKIKE